MVRYNACALGITDNLVRISIGVEDADDLITDFENALRAVRPLALARREGSDDLINAGLEPCEGERFFQER
jgi:hypothetical protein